MKFKISFLLLLFSFSVFANPARKIASVDRDSGIKTFSNFISCKDKFNVLEKTGKKQFLNCTNQYLSSELGERKKKHYSGWLFFELTVSKARICEEQPEPFSYPDGADFALCFDITVNKKKSIGNVFFKRDAQDFKIIKIAY